MTCPACARAQHNPTSGLYYDDCMSCEARSIARSQEAMSRERDPSELQAAMRRMWPNVEQYRYGRTLVWGWIKQLERRVNESETNS